MSSQLAFAFKQGPATVSRSRAAVIARLCGERGVLFTPLWLKLATHIKVEVYDRDGGHKKPRVRLEIDAQGMLLARLTQLRTACVYCGSQISPVRVRKGGKKSEAHAFLAVTCPITTKMGCARSRQARDEYSRIKYALCPELADR